MIIQIEVLIFLFFLVVLIIGIMAIFIHKKIKLWRYKPENDKGRRAEESRGLASIQRAVLPTSNERYDLLPTTSNSCIRQDSSSNREECGSNGETCNPFKKIME